MGEAPEQQILALIEQRLFHGEFRFIEQLCEFFHEQHILFQQFQPGHELFLILRSIEQLVREFRQFTELSTHPSKAKAGQKPRFFSFAAAIDSFRGSP